MISPEECPHNPSDVVLVEDGSECCRCGLVADVMPAPTRKARMSLPTNAGNRQHIAEIRAMLAHKRAARAS